MLPLSFWPIKQSGAIKEPGQADKYQTTPAGHWGDDAEESAWWPDAVTHASITQRWTFVIPMALRDGWLLVKLFGGET